MKRRIAAKRRHASSVRPLLSEDVFTSRFRKEGCQLLLSPRTDFTAWVTLSGGRGAERDPVAVVRIVVVVGTVVVDISEVSRRVGGAGPPVRRGRKLQPTTYRYGKSLYRSRSFSITPLTRRISVSTMSIHNVHPELHRVRLQPEQLVRYFDLRNETLKLRVGVNQIVPPNLRFVLIPWEYRIGPLDVFVDTDSAGRDWLGNIESVPLREVHYLPDRVDLKLPRCVKKLLLRLPALGLYHGHALPSSPGLMLLYHNPPPVSSTFLIFPHDAGRREESFFPPRRPNL